MTTPAELAASPSKSDVLLRDETHVLAEALRVAAQDLRDGVGKLDRVAAWNGMLRVSWITQLLERRLKIRVVLEDK